MRLLEVIAKDKAEDIEKLLDTDHVVESWSYQSEKGEKILKILIQDEHASEMLAVLEKSPQHRVVIYPIEGTMPRVETPKKKEDDKIRIGKFIAISKEELYHDVGEPVSLTVNYVLMVVLSSFVAGIGILKDNIAIIIGAMVIAPFLGPNMSLAFGTILGDWSIIRKSISAGISATVLALVISMIWGYAAGDMSAITFDPEINYQDILLALICGFAGVISVISGQGTTLVGVMVAAALLPPLMRGGLLLGAEDYRNAINSFLIFMTNVISLNIAGIVTFYLAGIKPSNWWEKDVAKKKTRTALIVWTIALIIIILSIVLVRSWN
ncbi:MAG: TIGR00341 family protein [Cyclobacteriaceae bacterium]